MHCISLLTTAFNVKLEEEKFIRSEWPDLLCAEVHQITLVAHEYNRNFMLLSQVSSNVRQPK